MWDWSTQFLLYTVYFSGKYHRTMQSEVGQMRWWERSCGFRGPAVSYTQINPHIVQGSTLFSFSTVQKLIILHYHPATFSSTCFNIYIRTEDENKITHKNLVYYGHLKLWFKLRNFFLDICSLQGLQQMGRQRLENFTDENRNKGATEKKEVSDSIRFLLVCFRHRTA